MVGSNLGCIVLLSKSYLIDKYQLLVHQYLGARAFEITSDLYDNVAGHFFRKVTDSQVVRAGVSVT